MAQMSRLNFKLPLYNRKKLRKEYENAYWQKIKRYQKESLLMQCLNFTGMSGWQSNSKNAVE
jgi:hypothetical protein